jgi:signal transduction histidine kinase
MGVSIADYRHDLLTPVNHIIGYCEILIEDAEGSGQEQTLAGLKTILDQGRHLLEDIEHAIPGTREGNEADLSALRVQLRASLNPILEACDGMQWGSDAVALTRFADDLRKVRIAASSLVELADRIPTDTGLAPP